MIPKRAGLDESVMRIVKAGAVEIRDVDGGAKPFVYSSGNRGPGYLQIKGLVGQPETLLFLISQLAYGVVEKAEFDFINGNATGGMIPGWQLRTFVSELLEKEVPFTYLRESRKEGGRGELITGIENNPLIKKGMSALIVEELVNFAETTCNAAKLFREEGFPVSHAACILTYDHQNSNQRLSENNLSLVALLRLPQFLDIAKANNLLPKEAIDSYRSFLANPIKWQLDRKFVIPEDSAKRAETQGYKMRKLTADEALGLGAPIEKIKSFAYFKAE